MSVRRISRFSARLVAVFGAIAIAVAAPLLSSTAAAADDGSHQTPPPPPASTNGHGWIG